MQDSVPKTYSFLVVGGSLGGLLAGVALKRHGHDVTILERSPSALLHDQGAGIIAGGDTLLYFQQYDKLQRPLAVQARGRTYLNKAGEAVYQEEVSTDMTSWDLVYHVLRANFDGVDSEYLEGRAVPAREEGEGKAILLHDHRVTGLEECDGARRMRVQYRKGNGETGSIEADYIIGADGQGSLIRKLVLPDVDRTFPGYCALRSTLKEGDVTPRAREAFDRRFTFFHGPGIQILAYLIPGVNGSLEPGHRFINFVYYTNFPTLHANATTHPPSSNVSRDARGNPPNPNPIPFQEIMIDRDGGKHRITLPPGSVAPDCWAREIEFAEANLPPQFVELIARTDRPFVQAVTDVNAPQPPDQNSNVFFDGKVILLGDALSGFRPHTVASTNQAAFQANILAGCFQGGWNTPQPVAEQGDVGEKTVETNSADGTQNREGVTLYNTRNGMGRTSKAQETGQERFIRESLQYARLVQRRGVEMGNRSQFEVLPLQELIRDRQTATTKRSNEAYPDWVW